jgi:thymidylate kinase
MVQEIGLAHIEREIKFSTVRLYTLFEHLDKNGIEFIVLRDAGGDSKYARMQEVDLLVRSTQKSILDHLLTELGFIRYPAWGHEPHHFYFYFDPVQMKWIKIDAVDEIRYGRPFKDVLIPVSSYLLADRIKENGLFKPQMVDEFLTLVLHSCLDKPVIAHKHKARLLSLLRHIGSDDAQRRLLAERSHLYGFRSDMVDWVQAILAHRWSWIRKRARRIYFSMFRAHFFVNLRFALLTRIKRKMRPLLFLFQKQGVVIALVAPDGAGKSTLAKNLKMWWPWSARILYMGQNPLASTIGLPTSSYLHKMYKKGTPNPWHHMVRYLWFMNRCLENWLRHFMARFYKSRGRVVIMDRYPFGETTFDHDQHSMKKVSRSLLNAFQTRPDLTIMLDAPAHVLFERKGEHNIEVLEKQRRRLKAFISDVPNVTIVDAQMDAESVVIKVCDILQHHYRRGHESGSD